jgi:hypothetical protein
VAWNVNMTTMSPFTLLLLLVVFVWGLRLFGPRGEPVGNDLGRVLDRNAKSVG